MKSMIALIQREYLEHRGAFLYAPVVILGLLTLVLVGALGMERLRVPAAVATNSARLFELGFLAMAALWFVYLMASLFFYFADAFNADRRNNSMLFWKSMPASDFKILSSKMLAGFTIFPALIFVAMLVGGIIAYAMTLAAAMRQARACASGCSARPASSSRTLSPERSARAARSTAEGSSGAAAGTGSGGTTTPPSSQDASDGRISLGLCPLS